MSQAAFEAVVDDFKTWEWEDAYNDKICLYDVSKEIRGEFRVDDVDNQDCEGEGCSTLKHHSVFRMELASGGCDSDLSGDLLSGRAEGEVVAAFRDSGLTNRGGHTGRFKWGGGGADLYGRLRGIVNACTHRDPVVDCLECHTPDHADGWIRAAVINGSHEGCRVAAMYSMKIDRVEGGGQFEGTLEGLLICQCAEEAG